MGCLFSTAIEMDLDHSRPSTELSEKGCMAAIRRGKYTVDNFHDGYTCLPSPNVLPRQCCTSHRLCSKKLQSGVSVPNETFDFRCKKITFKKHVQARKMNLASAILYLHTAGWSHNTRVPVQPFPSSDQQNWRRVIVFVGSYCSLRHVTSNLFRRIADHSFCWTRL